MMIGLDANKYSTTMNDGPPKVFILESPSDSTPRKFFVYVSPDEFENEHLRLEVIPDAHSRIFLMMSRIEKSNKLNFVKRFHRFTHTHVTEMRTILTDADILTTYTRQACNKLYDSCLICSSSEKPLHKKKVSVRHVNDAFNVEV